MANVDTFYSTYIKMHAFVNNNNQMHHCLMGSIAVNNIRS